MRSLCVCLTVTLFACGPGGTGPGGTGGGSASKPVAKARITAVTATYTANARSELAPTVTDYMDNCMGNISSGIGTNTMELREVPNPALYNIMGATVTGSSSACTGRHVTNSGTTPCTFDGAGPAEYPAFTIRARALSWTDSTLVDIEMPTLWAPMGSCNYGGFGGQWDNKFTLTEPLSSFRGTQPFQLKFSGTNTMTAQAGYTASWVYDVTVTVTPMN